MKKLLLIVGLAFAVCVAQAATFTLSSFIRPPVLSIVISNNIGWTNLETIANIQGANPQTNANGAVTNVDPVGWIGYTSAPAIYIGTNYAPGTFVIITNNTPVNPGTNATGVITNGLSFVTNNTQNVFQDVTIEPGIQGADDLVKPGAAGSTNMLGVLYVRSWINKFNVTGTVGGGSNIVNLLFCPVLIGDSPTAFGGGRRFEPSVTAGYPEFIVTYTNQITGSSATLSDPTVPTIFQIPIPRYLAQGANGLRLRAVYSGNTTNAVWIDTIALGHWSP